MVGHSATAASVVSLSGTTLPRRQPPSAVTQTLALRVVDAVAQGLGAEAAEDDGVRRADAGAGEQGNRQLGDHRHVEGDAVALLARPGPAARRRRR